MDDYKEEDIIIKIISTIVLIVMITPMLAFGSQEFWASTSGGDFVNEATGGFMNKYSFEPSFTSSPINNALASGYSNPKTATIFKMGPFRVSFDLGTPMELEFFDPYHEKLSHPPYYAEYTEYGTHILSTYTGISLRKFDMDIFATVKTENFIDGVSSTLQRLGCDKETIRVNSRMVDGKMGAIGSGLSKNNMPMYAASYYVSPSSVCQIEAAGDDDYQIMEAIMNTIHITVD
jgi:hypothetical protein